MWRRFGTPTADAGSGTEEEFNRAYRQFENTGRPHIMFYFCQADGPLPKTASEVDQLSRLVAFRDKLSQLALIWEYQSHSDFVDTVRPHLHTALKRVFSASQTISSNVVSTDARLEALHAELTKHANEYARVRNNMERGDARTRQLELIATRIRIIALESAPLLDHFVAGRTPGERLIAAVFLQVQPDPKHLLWLGERLGEAQPFVGYHAAVALVAAARQLDCSHKPEIDAAIALGHKRLGRKPSTDRGRTLTSAEAEIRRRCLEA